MAMRKREGEVFPDLISKELQPPASRARSTLTPALSRKQEREREREREREHVGSLSRVFAREGWGQSRSFEPHAASRRSSSGLQARTRTASEGISGNWLTVVANQEPRKGG